MGQPPQTVGNIKTVLRSALAQTLKWGLVSRNSAALVDAPRITMDLYSQILPAMRRDTAGAMDPDPRERAVRSEKNIAKCHLSQG